MLTLSRFFRLPRTAMSPVQICVIHQLNFVSEHERSKGARKFPGKISKFCEPLERVRARFSEKKILPKKAHWAATWGKNVPLSSTHL